MNKFRFVAQLTRTYSKSNGHSNNRRILEQAMYEGTPTAGHSTSAGRRLLSVIRTIRTSENASLTKRTLSEAGGKITAVLSPSNIAEEPVAFVPVEEDDDDGT